MKLELLVITIMFLYGMTPISSTSKDHEVGGNKHTQNMEELLNLNQNLSHYEQGLQDQQDTFEKIPNQTSKYNGVYWHRDNKKWQARLTHNKNKYYGGCFDNEEHAAMSVNLLCDKYGKKRKNPMIIIEPDVIQQVPNKTSKYNGVCWHRDNKKWQVQLMHNKKLYYGGSFDNEEHAAWQVNLLCEKYTKERKNPMIDTEPPDVHQQVPNKTSQYNGVSWQKDAKKWRVQFVHNKKKYSGGYFDNEEHAAMQANLLCDKMEIERKNPTVIIEPDAIQQPPNQTSQYNGVSWQKNAKKWKVQLMHNKKRYFGGYYDNEEQAGMKVNLLCKKFGKECKNPMIETKSDAIQQVPNRTSQYIGVSWHKDKKKWEVSLYHKKKYYGGLFDNEKQAAMKINLLCDKNGIERKNPMINLEPDAMQQVNKEIKVEDGNTLNGFKDECENRFTQSNEEESRITTTSVQSQKRKRKKKTNYE